MCLGPQSRSQNRRKDCLFLYRCTLSIYLGDTHFMEGMKVSDLLKEKLLSLASLCIRDRTCLSIQEASEDQDTAINSFKVLPTSPHEALHLFL